MRRLYRPQEPLCSPLAPRHHLHEKGTFVSRDSRLLLIPPPEVRLQSVVPPRHFHSNPPPPPVPRASQDVEPPAPAPIKARGSLALLRCSTRAAAASRSCWPRQYPLCWEGATPLENTALPLHTPLWAAFPPSWSISASGEKPLGSPRCRELPSAQGLGERCPI